jgi:hypothetical protein
MKDFGVMASNPLADMEELLLLSSPNFHYSHLRPRGSNPSACRHPSSRHQLPARRAPKHHPEKERKKKLSSLVSVGFEVRGRRSGSGLVV